MALKFIENHPLVMPDFEKFALRGVCVSKVFGGYDRQKLGVADFRGEMRLSSDLCVVCTIF